ncbi:MAG: hypothetical protein AABY86_09860, partial [Bdellovibrionota bacterium]
LKMLGLTDEDLQYMPPRNFAEAAEDFAVTELNKGLDEATPLATGLGLYYLMILGWALSSPFHLINCLIPPHPSVAAYVVGSGIYIGVEIDAALEYEELLNRINKLVKGGQKSLQVTLDDVKALQNEGQGIAADVQADVRDLYNTCNNLVGQLQGAGSGAASSAANCLPSIPGVSSGGGGGDSQQCLDDTQADYNDTSSAIHDCIARAQSDGLTATDLKNKGVAFLDKVDKAGKGAVNQLKMLKFVRDMMQDVTDIINVKANNALVYAAFLTVAAGLAVLETVYPPWGACAADIGTPPHLQTPGRSYAQMAQPSLPTFSQTLAQTLISEAKAQDDAGDATGSGPGQQSTRNYKKFSQKEVEDKLDKMIGHDVIALVVGIGIGLLVSIVMQILIA